MKLLTEGFEAFLSFLLMRVTDGTGWSYKRGVLRGFEVIICEKLAIFDVFLGKFVMN